MQRIFLIVIIEIIILASSGFTEELKETNDSLTQEKAESNDRLGEWTPRIGGCGGIFLKASKGPLTIEIEKQDRNLHQHHTDLQAIFVGPDRKVIQEKKIPDDGLKEGSGIGPGQTIRLSTHVKRPGVYAVMITVSNDRYGEDILWRFRTNCSRFMIETSRGHRDAPHKEPIILRDPERESDLCFLPQKKAFDIDISNLPKNLKKVNLWNAKNKKIATLKTENGQISHTIEAGERESTPWHLHLPKAKAKVEIDGVTRWKTQNNSPGFFSQYPDLSLWSPDKDSWFSLHKNRWLITPYNRTVYGQAGEEKSINFKVHNNGTKPSSVHMYLEFPNKKWDVKLSDKHLEIDPKEEKTVTLSWRGISDDKKVHLRATCGNYSTYSTLYAKSEEAPAYSPVKTPVTLKPFRHENKQFGYLPDYPVENQVYFNKQNRPFIRTSKGVTSLSNGKWETAGFSQPVSSPHAGGWTKVAFDEEGDVYALALKEEQPVLLHSDDGGETFSSYDIPGSNTHSSFDIEQFSGHNIPKGPPPIVRYTRTEEDEDHFWRRWGDMELLIPKKTKHGIDWKDPVLISEKCLGVSSHSGLPSSIVSRGSKIHVAWGEATDPEKDVPGVPAYVTTYQRETGKLEKPVIVGYGAPPNDVHNTPSITMDSTGHLHVLTGTHGNTFKHAHTLDPNNIQGGWTEAKPVGKDLRQTYIGMVTGPDNTLHLVFRLWRSNTTYFPNSYFAALAYMSKNPGEPWSEPRTLVVAPFSNYSIYYHRLTIDRKGRLFLSYDYWSTYWFYRTDHRGRRRTLLMSPDGGKNWEYVSKEDLMP